MTTEATATEPANLTTPSDSVQAEAKPKRKPKNQRRYRLFDDGDGDYRIYLVSENPEHPKGTLLPAPGSIGFESAALAYRHLKKSGDQFAGSTVMVLRGLHIVKLELDTQPRVIVTEKPRRQVSGAPKE